MLCKVIRWNIGVSIVVYMTVYFFARENILKSPKLLLSFLPKNSCKAPSQLISTTGTCKKCLSNFILLRRS